MALPRLLTLALLCLLAFASSANAAGSSTLFVQETSSGSLRQVAKDRYVLTVRPRGDMTAFTDRPQRRVWRLGTSTFLRRWSLYGFTTVPPNAVLALDRAPAKRDTLAVSLLSARALQDGRVAFTVAPMRGAANALAGYAKGKDRLSAGALGPGSLFVDDAGDVHTLHAVVQVYGTETGVAITTSLQGAAGVGTFSITANGKPLCSKSSQYTFSTGKGFVTTTFHGSGCSVAAPLPATVVLSLPVTFTSERLINVSVMNDLTGIWNPGIAEGNVFAATCSMAFDVVPAVSASAPPCSAQTLGAPQ